MPAHHPIFSSFTPFRGEVPPYFIGDFLGANIAHEFVAGWCEPCTVAHYVEAAPPQFDEEYFEWIALLEAVSAAKSSFTMIELCA